jgi:hypothetical protein
VDIGAVGKWLGDSLASLSNAGAYVVDAVVKLAVGFAFLRIAQKFNDIRSEIKNRVSGVYVTHTAGTAWLGNRASDDPSKVERNLFLWQSGRGLHGVEYGTGENAEWELKAHLTQDGFVSGRYWQTTPRTGIARGAFYLEQVRKDPRRFSGQFSGWNDDKGEITSNSYEWERVKLAPKWTVLAPRILRGLWASSERKLLAGRTSSQRR